MNPPTPPADQDSSVLGRRSSPRLSLRIPAKLISTVESQDCELVDVSLTGALLRLARPLNVDACGYLRAGPLEAFAVTVRVNQRFEAEALSAMEFDPPLTRDQILELRAYARQHQMIERRTHISAARDWVRGVGR